MFYIPFQLVLMFNKIYNYFRQPKIYIIYNLCDYAYNNTNFYIKSIENLLNQKKYKNFKIIISAACDNNHTINNIYAKFKNKIHICYIKNHVPVQISYNFTVKQSIERLEPADWYFYVDSGINFENNNLILKKLSKVLKQNLYSIIHLQTQETKQFTNSGQYILKPGDSVPLVCALFSHKIYEAYDNLLPDIFKGMYMEETLPFLAAGISSKEYIMPNLEVNHKAEMDGTALVAECTPFMRGGGKLWKQPYIISEDDFMERLTGKVAKSVGLGYTESLNISKHDKTLYNDQYFHTTPEILKDYIKTNLFFASSEFDYNNLNYEWI